MDIQVSFAPKPMVIKGATIGFTESAANKVKALVEEEKNPKLKLRVSVDGGGCSGFQYEFAFDESLSDDDTVVEKNGATVVIDVTSMQYLNGSEVDYLEGLEGARFVVNNPNATSTCGCGSSFSITL
jgi:iron-sulfur cluster insertion protein